MNRFFGFVLILMLLPFTTASARKNGLYAIVDGTVEYVNEFGLKSNPESYARYRTSGNKEGDIAYRKALAAEMSLGMGFLFGDKGQGYRWSAELSALLGMQGLHYKDEDAYYESAGVKYHRNMGDDERYRYAGLNARLIRRINLGGGWIYEPSVKAGYQDGPYDIRYNDGEWKEFADVYMAYFSLNPLAIEYNCPKNEHFGFRMTLGSLGYLETIGQFDEPFVSYFADFSSFSASFIYYF
jgi:hypothetical protein